MGMKCLNCKGGEFREKQVGFAPEVKGETVKVRIAAYVCSKCETPMMSTEQMNALQSAAADAYRKAHDLLTSTEIVANRKRLRMSQVEFSRYLGVGSASIARWETFAIQDKAQDELIRLKCDEDYAASNSDFVSARSSVNEFTGNREFDPDRLMTVLLHFVPLAKSPLYINKAAFYVDFYNYREQGKSVTGARYIPFEHGPCPEKFYQMFRRAKSEGLVESKGKHDLKLLTSPDLSIFAKEDLSSIEFVTGILKKKGFHYLYEMSHKEKGYKAAKALDYLSYDFAKDLLI